jgi:NSS family neurotransmitter:Na+ symporter
MSNGNSTGRGSWGTRFGFIIAAAGSAVGLGNVWKFPYITGENGGGAFLVVYLICIAAIGTPIMLAELSMGRKSRRNIVGAYQSFKKGKAWIIAGWMAVAATFMIISFYGVVAGWTIAYMVKSVTSTVTGFSNPKEAGVFFETFAANTVEALFYQFLFMFLCAIIVVKGIKSGIERWCKVLMPMMLLILIILMVRSLTLPGAMEGVAFFLTPDFSKLTPHSILVALGHSFFTLSLGMGILVTYGSYLDESHNLPFAALVITLMDTVIAVLAGMVIFPAVFAMGLEPASGPGLIFHIIPAVFSAMNAGNLFSFAFFALLGIAALTSGISLLEVVVAWFIDEWNWKREKAVVVISIAIFLFGVPCNLSFGLLSDVKLFGLTFFGAVDFLASNYFLPLGGLCIAIFVGWIWGMQGANSEVQKGYLWQDTVYSKGWGILIRYIAPIAVLFIFLSKLMG